jgi:hypothetical protein
MINVVYFSLVPSEVRVLCPIRLLSVVPFQVCCSVIVWIILWWLQLPLLLLVSLFKFHTAVFTEMPFKFVENYTDRLPLHLRPLVPCILTTGAVHSPRNTRFDPIPVQGGFAAKWYWKIYLLTLRFSPVKIIPPKLHTHSYVLLLLLNIWFYFSCCTFSETFRITCNFKLQFIINNILIISVSV